MLQIRTEQVPALSTPPVEFRRQAAAHVRRHFPEAGAMDEVALDELIIGACVRAAGYGISTQQDVCKYLNLMFTFGRNFDTDPALPWVTPLLRSKSKAQGTLRINRLCRQALEHIEHARGLEATP
ncbi:MAG: hypothetical protein AAF799_16245 [Myxococcota bacterium]